MVHSNSLCNPVLLLNVPTGHGTGFESLRGQKKPLGHNNGVTVAAKGQTYPAEHAKQLLIPLEFAKEPGGQAIGRDEVLGHIKPTGHKIIPFGLLTVMLPGQ